MGSVSVRMAKTNAVGASQAHALRTKVPSYVDPNRTSMNAILEPCVAYSRQVDRADVIRMRMNERHKSATNRAMRKDTKTVWDGIVTFSRDANPNQLDRAAMDKCVMDLIRMILKRHWGAHFQSEIVENTLWLVRHEDETTVHYHFALVNQHVTTSKPVRLSPADLRAIQDLAGKAFESLGLSRGKSKQQRIADGEPRHKVIHRSVRELHEDLPRELEHAKKMIKKYERLIQKHEEKLAELQSQIELANSDISYLTDEIESKQRLLSRYEKRLSKYEQFAQAVGEYDILTDEILGNDEPSFNFNDEINRCE